MEDPRARYDALLQAGVRRLRGHQRRLFMAEVARDLCAGSPRQAERRFGWGRGTVTKGLHELAHGIRCQDNFSGRGRPRWEDQHPQRAHDIRAVVDPRCHADPELKSDRRYTNLSAAEVLQALKAKKGYRDADLPSVRTMRDILNRLGYRLKRLQKAKPLKKTKDTDAIFANVQAVRDQYKGDPDTLEVSVDTKAKVNEGDYSRGGKNPDGLRRPGPEGVGP